MTVTRLRLGLAWLTLLAFGVQIAVADFHHHRSSAAGMEARALTAGMCPPSHTSPCAPAEKGHDGCALCWAVAIAATSLTPDLFYLPAPSKLAGDKLRSRNPQIGQTHRMAEVRARGPPSERLG